MTPLKSIINTTINRKIYLFFCSTKYAKNIKAVTLKKRCEKDRCTNKELKSLHTSAFIMPTLSYINNEDNVSEVYTTMLIKAIDSVYKGYFLIRGPFLFSVITYSHQQRVEVIRINYLYFLHPYNFCFL